MKPSADPATLADWLARRPAPAAGGALAAVCREAGVAGNDPELIATLDVLASLAVDEDTLAAAIAQVLPSGAAIPAAIAALVEGFQMRRDVSGCYPVAYSSGGDDLQGIKRGIMELADALVVNKADGESVGLAQRTRRHYQNAMNLLSHSGFWVPRVLTCSATENRGITEVWKMIEEYRGGAEASGELQRNRALQNAQWLRRLISELLEQRFRTDPRVRDELPRLEERVVRGEMTPYAAAVRLLGSA